MNEGKAREVALWLNSLEHIKDARAVVVVIGEGDKALIYYGAVYVAIGHYTAGMRAVTEGKHKDGEEYLDTRFYLMGDPPWKIKGRRKFCFPYNGSDWFIGGWYDGGDGDSADLARFAKYHPFGHYIGVHEWKVPDGQKIDHYEETPYLRVPMTVTEL